MGTAEASEDRMRALLLGAPLRHVVTLKMLHLFGPASQTRFLEDANGWGLLSVRPVQSDDWDRTIYPDREWVVLVDGTSSSAKQELLARLPPAKYVVKTYDETVKSCFERLTSVRPGRSYISFTASAGELVLKCNPAVWEGGDLEEETARLIAENGYGQNELVRHFADGARWFALRTEGKAAAAGFVFRNFESIWEIGGIYTLPEFRRRGLAKEIVLSALRHLFKRGLTPRYQVRSDNAASIQLARSCGLRQFLKVDHLLVDL